MTAVLSPDLYGRHASTDDVCHRGSCPRCLRSKWRGAHPDRLLPVPPTRHTHVQVVAS